MTWIPPKIWDGGRCLILGGGPSLAGQFDIPQDLITRVTDSKDPLDPRAYSRYMELIHDEHVIAVNNSYLLGDWPDICHFGDWGWYKVHRERLASWPGLKVSHSPSFADPAKAKEGGVKYMPRDRAKRMGLSDNPGKLSWGFNTGSSAIDLAVHLGAKQVILLGFDMRNGRSGETHWHRGHGPNRRPASYARFLQGFPVIAKDARRLGVEIINCSPGTSITEFPVANLKEIL